jgi:4-hydroxy-2-oxoheptanedioate aldolase
LQKNRTKSKLKSGETVLGCFIRYPDPTLVEVLGYQPWDFIVFDGEHGTIEPRDCENMVRAAEIQGITPIIRVPTNLAPVILRFMDTGAHGLHIPMINSGNEAENAVRSVKYLPRGARGLAGVRASDFGQKIPLGEYVVQANNETLIAIHIETVEAVENLSSILRVEDIDVIFVGPNDLSNSLGFPGQTQHPKVQETIEHIAGQVAQAGRLLGIMVGNAAMARQWRDKGARYITIVMDGLLGPACRNYLNEARG